MQREEFKVPVLENLGGLTDEQLIEYRDIWSKETKKRLDSYVEASQKLDLIFSEIFKRHRKNYDD